MPKLEAISILNLIISLEPAIQDTVVALINAVRTKDPEAERKAWETALRLQFEARQKQ